MYAVVCMCTHVYKCELHLHTDVFVVVPEAKHHFIFSTSLFLHVKIWSFLPAIKPNYLEMALLYLMFSCSLDHKEVTWAKSSPRWLFVPVDSFLGLSPQPCHHPASRTTLALIILLNFLIFPHLLFTEGLNFFLAFKTSLPLEKQNVAPSVEN
jgi:hypothetical protein